jgi:hypothetical protein
MRSGTPAYHNALVGIFNTELVANSCKNEDENVEYFINLLK